MKLGNYLLSLTLASLFMTATTELKAQINIGPKTPGTPGPAASILKMVQSGVETNVVLAFIDSNAAPFGMTADDVLALRAKGVSSDVLTAMLRHDAKIVQFSRISPPVSNVSSQPNEEPAPFDAPQADSYENPPPTIPGDQEWAPFAPWVNFQDSGRHYWHPNEPVDRRSPSSRRGGKPGPGVQSLQPAPIAGTVPLVQPTVPFLQPTVPFLQPVVPLFPSAAPVTPPRARPPR